MPFLNWSSMVSAAPQLVRLKAYRSVYSTVARYIRDPHLRQLFSFHSLLVGGNPFTTTSIYTLIHCLERKWGVFFAKGGTGALVEALVKLFKELGGEIRLNSEISEISTARGKVTGVVDGRGRYYGFDLVASNADVVHTYHALLRKESTAARMRHRLSRSAYSMSLFLIYFGTRRKYPNLLHHNIIFGPRYPAHQVYSEIGRALLRKGARAWDERTYVTGARKLWVVSRAMVGIVRSLPARLLRPWQPAPLRIIWKVSNVR